MAGLSGDAILVGTAGADNLNGGSGSDIFIYNLSAANSGFADVYTGGSGTDTIRLELTAEQWLSEDVRTQLASYVQFLETVKTNPTGEVSNGIASDFTFDFG